MSQDKPKARKSAQRDAYASGKRFDAAIGLSWLTPKGRGPFALPVRRESLQTIEVCCAFAPAGSTKVLASMPIHL
ncbi:hypothetical protein [Hyphomicrobium nitrativorans]|uniref:hypothetical protein n=1 Tax=Hyphomicrobium nitrativorans TaxID=1427356 RepID=UPI000A8B2D14|nr:hypothetical protein [Hyphomicrobium nitrativorans]